MDEARLRSIPLFAGLSKHELREIARVADEVDVAAGKRLIDRGETAYEFFVIEDGSCEVKAGDRQLAELGPGDFMGEMGSLARAKRNASVVATSQMTAVVMTARDLRRVEHEMPELHGRLQAAIDERSAALAG